MNDNASPYGVLNDYAAKAITASLASLDYKVDNPESTLTQSKEFGDIACSIAFRIAKEKKENPKAIAERIAEKIPKNEYISKVTVERGYINFHFERGKFAKLVLDYSLFLNEGDQTSGIGKGQKVIVEYPSANPIHPLHVGQLRNMLLGDSVSRLHSACGYRVESEDYIDDLGLQAIQALWGYLQTTGKADKKFDHWLGDIYAGVNKRIEAGEDLKAPFSALAKRAEAEGNTEAKASREVSERCVVAQYETAFNYGIYHDVMIWEGDILRERLLEKALKILSEAKVIRREVEGKYKDCVVMDLEQIKELPKEFKGQKEMIKVLVKSDGTASYVAKDIAFHMWKFGMLGEPFRYSAFIEKQPNGKPVYTTGADGNPMEFGGVKRAINIIDVKQSFPQALVKLAFSAIGRQDIADGIEHLAYGRVELEEGKLSGRKGVAYDNTADGLLEAARAKAGTMLRGKTLELSKEEQDGISNAVALAAIKFGFLKTKPELWMTFSWERAMAFEGDSGPYCQYTYARAIRLVEASGTDTKRFSTVNTSILVSDDEFGLIKQIAKLPETVERACKELKPNIITEYAVELAFKFSNFYEKLPILKATDNAERASRLALTVAFANSMKYTLSLLGIPVVNRM
jgi:arginyl-tRNA synthetase